MQETPPTHLYQATQILCINLVPSATLTPDHREVLILRHAAGLTFDQIATATETPRSTIATRHAAALRALHQSLAPKSPPLTKAAP